MFATLAGALPTPPADAASRGARASREGVAASERHEDIAASASHGDVVASASHGDVAASARHEDVGAAIALQVGLGLEPVTDGDLGADPLTTTALGLEAVALDDSGRPCLHRGIPVAWRRPIHLDRWRIAATLTDRAVKQIVGGPYSLGRLLGATQPDPGRRQLTLALAEALNAELRSLATVGCPLVQVDEPRAVSIGDSPVEAALFRDAARRLLDGLDGVHVSLAVTGGNADAAGPATFFDAPFASYLFDLIDGPDNWRLIARAPSDRGIVCGAVPGARGAEIEKEVVIWAAHYAASTMGRGLVRVGLSTSGSLAGLSWDEARERLELLALAAEIAAEPVARMVERLDPLAFGPGARRRGSGR